jgi:peptidoglycan/LPS O-acetylase OafA/YrhL
LRAIAVLSVLLNHAGLPFLSGGYVGVDIFFVISGFLIVRLIHAELVAERFSLLDFYERRARRILPALFPVLGFCFLLSWVLLLPGEWMDFAPSAIATTFFASNIWFEQALGNYFGPSAEFAPLLHTWSLAVEEQFYILAPILLLALWRFAPAALTPLVLIATLLSFASAACALSNEPSAAFYYMPYRAWELGVGALLALRALPALKQSRPSEIAALAGLLLMVIPLFLYGDETPFPGPYALLPVLGAALIIHAGTCRQTIVSRLLGLTPLVLIGLISYSLYLWHWPILVFLRLVHGGTELPALVSAAAILASLLMAWLSYRFIEQPFRRRSAVPLRMLMQTSLASAAAAIAVSSLGLVTHGFASRLEPSHWLVASAVTDKNPVHASCLGRRPSLGLCALGDASASPTFLFWGDSHADALMPALDQAAREMGAGGLFAGATSCPPLLGVTIFEGRKNRRCPAFNEEVIEEIESRADIGAVILAARWAGYVEQRPAEEPGARWFLLDRVHASAGAKKNFDVLAEGLNKTVARLRQAGKTVIILSGTPEISWNVPRALYYERHWGIAAPKPPLLAEVRLRNARVDDLFGNLAERQRLSIVDLPWHLCRPRCRVEYEGRPLYHDDDHISRFGATRMLSGILKEEIWRKPQALEACSDMAAKRLYLDC